MSALLQKQLMNQVVTSNYTGAPIDTPDVTMLSLVCVLTAGSGAGNVSVFIEGSCDGSNWDPIPPSWGKDYNHATAAPYGNFNGNRVNIVSAAVGTEVSGNSNATYAHLGFTMIRPRVSVSGSVSFNIRIDASGK